MNHFSNPVVIQKMLDQLSVKLSDKFEVSLDKDDDGQNVIESIKAKLQTESRESTVKILGAAAPRIGVRGRLLTPLELEEEQQAT